MISALKAGWREFIFRAQTLTTKFHRYSAAELPGPQTALDIYSVSTGRGPGGTTASDLLAICSRLINKGETLQYLDSALKRISTLLTLEDLVSWRGAEWGFDNATIDIARDRSVYFDQVAGRSRYRVPGE